MKTLTIQVQPSVNCNTCHNSAKTHPCRYGSMSASCGPEIAPAGARAQLLLLGLAQPERKYNTCEKNKYISF